MEGYQRMNETAQLFPDTLLVYMGDREADIYELFAEHAQQSGPHAELLIRVAQTQRKLMNSDHLLPSVEKQAPLGDIEFSFPGNETQPRRTVIQTLRAAEIELKPPYRSDRTLPPVTLTVILAREENPPEGCETIEWVIATTLPITTVEQAAEKVRWYLCRWGIEIFFKILKSGCTVEKLQLEHIDRLEPALAFYMIIAWRVLFLTMLGRACPDLPCDVVFDTEEWQAVYMVIYKTKPPEQPPSLDDMVRHVAMLGGFLNRKYDGPPGPKTLWIGLQRARDFVLALDAQRVASG